MHGQRSIFFLSDDQQMNCVLEKRVVVSSVVRLLSVEEALRHTCGGCTAPSGDSSRLSPEYPTGTHGALLDVSDRTSLGSESGSLHDYI